METFKRYRVKAARKSWASKGPDLLRKRHDAERAVGKLMLPGSRHWRMRVRSGTEWGQWSRPLSRKKVLRRLHGLELKNRDRLVAFGKGPVDKVETRIIVKVERVPFISVASSHRDVSTTWSLIRHQFPNVLFAGGFVFKKIAGTDSYSDHAWGDALDATPRGKGVNNDGLFDWQVRMGKSGNLPVHGYILGSRGGRVKKARATSFIVLPSGASTSHLWHNHDSIFDHGGAKPPDANGRR